MGRRSLSVVAVSGLIVGLWSLAAVPAEATVPFTVSQVTLSATSLSVAGFSTAPLTASVRLTGCSPAACGTAFQVRLLMGRSGGRGTLITLAVNARLISGTASDGVWSGTVQVPSTADGSWAVYRVCAPLVSPPVTCGNVVDVTGSPAVRVTGTHLPALSAGQVPNPAPVSRPAITIKGRVTDSTTGAGLPGVAVWYGQDQACSPGTGGFATLPHTSTDAAGYYGFPAKAVGVLECILVRSNHGIDALGYEQPIIDRQFFPLVQSWLTAVPSHTSLPVGQADPVFGRTPPLPGLALVWLEQLRGATQWRFVSIAHLRSSGRFTLTATPTVVAKNYYRALLPGGSGGPLTSPVFTIVGT
jgi:hypothetical protein